MSEETTELRQCIDDLRIERDELAEQVERLKSELANYKVERNELRCALEGLMGSLGALNQIHGYPQINWKK